MAASTEILEPVERARYADAIVGEGVGFRRGDLLVLTGEPSHRELLVAVAEAAYRQGARHVELEVHDPLVAAARFRHGGKGALGVTSPWEATRARALMRPDAAHVHIAGDGEPGAFEGIDPQRLSQHQTAIRKALSWYVRASLGGRVRWTIAAWPTEPWAKQVYPRLRALEAQRQLARDLLSFCRVGADDPAGTAGWREHAKTLETRRRKLTRLGLERLELRGPGTALDVRLTPGTTWLGGRERTASGHLTSPNMPTEEVFTSPDPRPTAGTFRCSRPLVFRGQTIDGIAGELRGGRLVRLEAAREQDRDLLAAFLFDSDPNARRLGELALVDNSSRVGSAGRTYFSTLLDENAAAHIAFGAGFPNTREPGSRGVNRSSLHLDVMIGTDDFEVTGFAARGRRVPLIAAGAWAI